MNAARSKDNEKDRPVNPMITITDEWTDSDFIGFNAYSEALYELIHSIESKGAFSIGVFGEWGQGKTSLLRQIKKTLDHQFETTDDAVFTIWFNPWRYKNEPNLFVPLLTTILISLSGYLKGASKEKDIITGLSTRVKAFTKTMKDLPLEMSQLLGTKGQTSSPITQLERAALELNGKVVVFIDDLDRCPPLQALDLLENIHTLLNLYGFVFVTGMSRDALSQAIQLRYREHFRSTPANQSQEKDFLEKIVQFSFNLPSAETNLFKEYVQNKLLSRNPQYLPYLNTVLAVLDHTPRRVKRFLNSVSFCNWIARRTSEKGLDPIRLELIVKASLIAFQFPELYSQLCLHPHHLIHLQNIIWALDDENNSQKHPRVEKKTKIQEIDRWLEEPFVSKISAILAKERRNNEDRVEHDQGFKNREEVERYIRLLAPLVPANFSAPVLTEHFDASLKHLIEDRMKRLEGGTFQMGDWESSQLDVSLDSFLLDIYPVTQSLYQQIMGKNPSRFSGVDQPVESVSWFDAIHFCNRLSEKTGLKPAYVIEGDLVTWDRNARGFRLPTEAEWEYACRAGSQEDRYGVLDEIGWYEANSKGTPHGVGQKLPNEFGMFDMIGNVWEWVWDWFDDYTEGPVVNPTGPKSGSFRVVRGGSWFNVAHVCRTAVRDGSGPAYIDSYLGFRIARSCPPD